MRILGLTDKGLKIKTEDGHIIYYSNHKDLNSSQIVDKLIKFADSYDKMVKSKKLNWLTIIKHLTYSDVFL